MVKPALAEYLHIRCDIQLVPALRLDRMNPHLLWVRLLDCVLLSGVFWLRFSLAQEFRIHQNQVALHSLRSPVAKQQARGFGTLDPNTADAAYISCYSKGQRLKHVKAVRQRNHTLAVGSKILEP